MEGMLEFVHILQAVSLHDGYPQFVIAKTLLYGPAALLAVGFLLQSVRA